MLGGLRLGRGVLVAARSADAPSAEQGLEAGDLIVSMNGVPVLTLVELRSAVARLPARVPVVLQIQRDGQLMFIALEIP
jgi:S1-C subfamily serine protease